MHNNSVVKLGGRSRSYDGWNKNNLKINNKKKEEKKKKKKDFGTIKFGSFISIKNERLPLYIEMMRSESILSIC